MKRALPLLALLLAAPLAGQENGIPRVPISPRGAWIFAVGAGVLVVLIRFWGGLPEGVMYAILLMNALTPFINQMTQPRVFGAPTRIPS